MLTTGRSGSTSLMEALERFPDVALPKRQIDCVDSELLRPSGFGEHRRAYQALTGYEIAGQDDLIDAFYRHSGDAAYAGFKSMPHRHERFAAFAARPDIRFIALHRRDVASTVASFLLARRANTWRRRGAPPAQRWTFRPADAAEALGVLYRLRLNLRALAAVPNAIRLTYEDLCRPDFTSPELEAFFGRPVRLEAPQPPVPGAAYTENWEDFLACLRSAPGALGAPGGSA